MNTYETLFVCPPDLTTEKVDDILEKLKRVITREGGQVQKEDRWGLKRLAYSIRGHREGLYVHLEFAAPPSVTSALTQTFHVLEGVLRHLVLKVEPVLPRRRELRKKERIGAAGAKGAAAPHSEGGGGRVGRHGGNVSGPRFSGGGRMARGSHALPAPARSDTVREEPAKGGSST